MIILELKGDFFNQIVAENKKRSGIRPGTLSAKSDQPHVY
jgi:hypothetical protein